ncbi:2Fe-2S iron-sulfur cluster-binding protein [Ferrovum sp.]|jgi:ferredoxin|uniref:2Fe-2S iron-sulfur cluster-binding protein n=2 Tax=Ferrovum sp. TaxID=2609467 RepID=UPI0026073DFA|nr:2Fe-2S iron-sulfur cluster-binding protein [Ferrovum sp.]MBW8067497.1 2Fe-2S iron-sulfur cluster binding domain-containing protein [Ferrovum sp.]
MVMVTFLTPPMQDKLVVETSPGFSLLELMERYNLRRNCVCGEGKCGACAVKIVPMRRTPKWITIGYLERIQFVRDGKLSKAESEQPMFKDIPPRWRLACQYIVSDEPILVVF